MTRSIISPPSDPHDLGNAAQGENDSRAPGEALSPGAESDASRAIPYVARILQQHLVDDPTRRAWKGKGTAVFVDISGFTKLSERLARKGREGAEQITEGHREELRVDPVRSLRNVGQPAQVWRRRPPALVRG
jgi:hypothetical protein